MNGSHLEYAGFWKRFAAYCIDSVIVGISGVVLLVPLVASIGLGAFSLEGSELSRDSSAALSLLFAIVAGYFLVILGVLLTGWLYFSLMESSSQQGTLGKMALSIKVTDMNGSRISFGRASGRYFGKFISNLTLGIGYIMAGFTQQKQALHDIIAGCLVVNK